uniref:Uncharacterized protein n=1 Tax=mine drainage metagenome TaxID=410659 RepID=E6QP08_9ZZZZ
MNCPYCGTNRFRLSHLRFSDLARILMLRYPIRCRLCRERSYVPIAAAMSIQQLHRKHAAEQSEAATETEATTQKH